MECYHGFDYDFTIKYGKILCTMNLRKRSILLFCVLCMTSICQYKFISTQSDKYDNIIIRCDVPFFYNLFIIMHLVK